MSSDAAVVSTRPIPELGAVSDELARDPQHALLLRQHTYDVDRLYSRLRELSGRVDGQDAAIKDLLSRIHEHNAEIARLSGRQTEQRTMLVDLDGKIDRIDARQQDTTTSLQSLTSLLHVTNGLLTSHVQEEAESQAHLTRLFHRAIRVLLSVFAILAALFVGQASAIGPVKVLSALIGWLGG